MCKCTDERGNTLMVAALVAIIAIFTIVALYFCSTKIEQPEKMSIEQESSGENRAFPASTTNEVEEPLPLQIDTNAPAKVTVRTKITL